MQMSLGELMQKIDAARARMGTSNANRALLGQCGAVLMALAQQVTDLQTKAKAAEEPRILIP